MTDGIWCCWGMEFVSDGTSYLCQFYLGTLVCHSPSKQIGSVTLLVHVHNPQPVSWIVHTIRNISISTGMDKTLYLWTSGIIWNSGQHVDSRRLGGTAQLGSWTDLWLWPGVGQWKSSQFLSLPPEEQARLWLHTPPAVPAAQRRDVWQQMSGSPCSWKKEGKKNK